MIVNRLAEQGYAEKTLREIKVTASQIMEVAPALRPEEVDLITNTYEGHRIGLPVLLMLYYGLRLGELCGRFAVVTASNPQFAVKRTYSI